jgi:ABC-type amino acid transport substrate-binding protein
MIQVTDTFGQTTTKLVGYMLDLIELLQNKMGFIPSITLVVNDVYDMFIAQTTITTARREEVAFFSSIFDISLRVIIRKESTVNVDLLSYLRPFSLQIWITTTRK